MRGPNFGIETPILLLLFIDITSQQKSPQTLRNHFYHSASTL